MRNLSFYSNTTVCKNKMMENSWLRQVEHTCPTIGKESACPDQLTLIISFLPAFSLYSRALGIRKS